MDNNVRYQTVVCGDAERYGATAFMLDTWVTDKVDIRYFEAHDDKKSRCTFAVTVNQSAWEILGRAEGDSQRYAGKPETHMIFCTAFDQLANKLHTDLKQKSHVVLFGRLQRATYTSKDGVEHENVSLNVHGLIPVDSFSNAPSYISAYSAANKKGERFPMFGAIAGTVTYVGELKQGSRDPYLRVTVKTQGSVDAAYARATGTYNKDGNYSAQTLSCTIWGNRATAMAKILKKDMPIILCGSVTTTESNGAMYYNMSVQGITLYPRDPNAASTTPAPAATAKPANEPQQFVSDFSDIDDDEELPF